MIFLDCANPDTEMKMKTKRAAIFKRRIPENNNGLIKYCSADKIKKISQQSIYAL